MPNLLFKAVVPNIRLAQKKLGTNTLAYSVKASETKKKSVVTLTLGLRYKTFYGRNKFVLY